MALATLSPAASSDGSEGSDIASPISSSNSNANEETQPLLSDATEEARNSAVAADVLRSDVTPRSPAPLATAAPARFTFFRSYRFPARPVASLVPEAAAAENATPAAPAESARSPSPVMPGSFADEADDSEAGDTSGTTAPTGGNPGLAPAAAAAAAPPSPPSMFGPLQVPTNAEVVPLLLVGVRSMTRPLADELADAGSGATAASSVGEAAPPARPTNTAPVDPANIPLPMNDDEDIDAEADEGNDDDELESMEPASRPSSSPAPAPSALPRTQPATPPPVSQGFVLWIMGGLYPSNHPLVIAPNLLSDDVLSYEDMLRLAEVLGSHKQPTATTDEIAKSDLQVIKGSQVGQFVEEEKILSITADRCLGELACSARKLRAR